MLEDFEKIWVCFVFSSIIFFSILSKLVASFGAPKSFSGDPWVWKNFSISWIHALFCAVWVLSCFVLTPEMVLDLVKSYSMTSYLLVCFSLGYFTFDFLDILINKKIAQMWEVALHHIVVLLIFYYNIANCHCIGFMVVALLTEVNSIFLHGRKLMMLAKVERSNLVFRTNAILNVITIPVCRGLAIGWIWKAIIYAKEDEFTPFNWWLLFITTLIMTVINSILFWTVFKNDFLRGKKGKKLNANNNDMKITDMAQNINGLSKID